MVLERQPRTGLEADDVEAGLGQHVRGDPARRAESDDRDVRAREALRHRSVPMRCSASVHTACGPS